MICIVALKIVSELGRNVIGLLEDELTVVNVKPPNKSV
jgi:hypothetical protein